MLRVDLVTVHASWQVNLNVTVNDGLYLVHWHTGERLCHRKVTLKAKTPLYGEAWVTLTSSCS